MSDLIGNTWFEAINDWFIWLGLVKSPFAHELQPLMVECDSEASDALSTSEPDVESDVSSVDISLSKKAEHSPYNLRKRR